MKTQNISLGRVCPPSKFVLLFSILFPLYQIIHAQTPQVTPPIGPTSGTGSWAYGPIYRNNGNAGLLNYSRHTYLYTATELGIPSGVKITKLEWLKKDSASVTGNNAFNVFMSNTSTATLATGTQWGSLITGATQVFGSTTYSVPSGTNTWLQFPLTDTFTYTGGNIQIATDWSKLGFATGAFGFYFLSAPGKAIGIASTTSMNNLALLQSANYGNARPTLRITYIIPPVCAGVPTTGSALSSASSVCLNVPFTLSIQNTIPGTGVTYLWQSATDIGFTQNVTSISTSASFTTTQSQDHYFRCTATCTASGLTSTSTPVFVPMAPSYGCYCSSQAVSSADEDIVQFQFGPLNNCSDCMTPPTGVGSSQNSYSNFQYLTPQIVEQGANIPFLIKVGQCANHTYSSQTSIFIDYNHNNSFSDPGELVYSSSSPTAGAYSKTGFVLIPASSLTGVTGLRVIVVEGNSPVTNPCLIYSWGETEDYLINIVANTNCAGAPAPGATVVRNTDCSLSTTSHAICSGTTIDLSLQNFTPGIGVTYQWYDNNGLIVGANGAVYTTPALTASRTYYCQVTCQNSGLTTSSTPITITMESFINCYCVSGAASNADEDIFSFSINGATNVSTCVVSAPGSGSTLNQYSNFTPLGALTSIQLGTTVPFAISVDDCDVPPAPYYSFGTSMWIDFNHNSSFTDPGEQVFLEPTAIIGPRVITGNINIPCSALPGQTRLRVSVVEGLSGSALTSCLAYGFGETEDYVINLVQPAGVCTTPIFPSQTQATFPSGVTITSPTPVVLCDSTSLVLSLQNKCLLGNYTYQWKKSPGTSGPFTNISGATSYTYTTPKIFETVRYICSITCGASPATLSPTIQITKSLTPSITLSASSQIYCSTTDNPVTLTATSTGSFAYSYPNNTVTPINSNTVSVTPLLTTIYTVLGTASSSGCTRTTSIQIQAVCAITLDLKCFIEGYYAGGSMMSPVLSNEGVGFDSTLTDSITVEIHSATAPYDLVKATQCVIGVNGVCTAIFPNTLPGSYYVVVKHRNSIETWSANSVAIGNTPVLYDFSSLQSKSYGGNMRELELNVWGLYSGDVNQDNNIDLLDVGQVEGDIENFLFGYVPSDVNGDGNVDLLDASTVEVNSSNFIYSNHP